MSEISDDELLKFLLENKEKVKKMLSETEETVSDKAKEKFHKAEEKVAEKAKKVETKVFTTFMSPEVMKHMVNAGVEFLLGVREIMNNIPVPDAAKGVKEKVDEVKAAAGEAYCEKNPDCAAKKKKKPAQIEID